ncbi:MAG TPA: hypothetical protein VLG92_02710 [Candidatus Saccharimonadia bacterium]|nr:hypothetical protein [Candidatus Saccharimonadia bacterium]
MARHTPEQQTYTMKDGGTYQAIGPQTPESHNGRTASALGGAMLLVAGYAIFHGSGNHAAAPSAGTTYGAQPSHSVSGPAVPGHTKETAKPKAPTSTSQKSLAPVQGSNVLSWPSLTETLPIDNIDLTGLVPRKVIEFKDPPKGVTLNVYDKVCHTVAYLTLAFPDLHTNENIVTVNADGQQLTKILGQETETIIPGTHIELFTSGESADALGLMLAPKSCDPV